MKTALVAIFSLALSSIAIAGRPKPVELDLGDLVVAVNPSILEPFNENMKKLAWEGSNVWTYVDSTQYRIDWWGVEIIPVDPDGSFTWSSRDRLYFETAAGDSVRVVDFVLMRGCQARAYELCKPVFPFSGVVVPFSALVVPQRNPRIQGYVGTKRGTLRPQDVVGLVGGKQ